MTSVRSDGPRSVYVSGPECYRGERDPTGGCELAARGVGRFSDKTSYPPCNRAHSRPVLLAGSGHSVQL